MPSSPAVGRRPWVLGIAASHNGAACLLHGEQLVAAVQEERLVRYKRARVYGAVEPLCARYCLAAAGITPRDLDAIVLTSASPLAAFDNDTAANRLICEAAADVLTIAHHRAHAIGALAQAGFSAAAVLVIDGAGSPPADWADDERMAHPGTAADELEWATLYDARAGALVCVEKQVVIGGQLVIPNRPGMMRFRSLGGMYGAVADQIFGEFMTAGKVMGLAAYGTPGIPASAFANLGQEIRFRDDVPDAVTHERRWPDAAREYADLAASVQRATETIIDCLVARARALGHARLCYAGGVALNSIANERIVNSSGFADVFTMPAAEDSGTAIGAAYHGVWSLVGRHGRPRRQMTDHSGAPYAEREIERALASVPALSVRREPRVAQAAAELLADGALLGWVQGRSELGPRALGQRSILCDPRVPAAKNELNARVKRREAFRPFGPMVLRAHVHEWFECERGQWDSPFMLRVLPFRRDRIAAVPAVVHADGTGRLQTVDRRDQPRLHATLAAFHELTGVPILLNTSFNTGGAPIVETPDHALRCFVLSGLDACVVGDYIVQRDRQVQNLRVRPTVRDLEVHALDGARFALERPASMVAGAEEYFWRFFPAPRATIAYGRGMIDTSWGEVVVVLDTESLAVLERAGAGATVGELDDDGYGPAMRRLLDLGAVALTAASKRKPLAR